MDSFQIVEYESSDIDAVRRIASERSFDEGDAQPSPVVVLKDRDRPDAYATKLQFDSYEDAMRHSEAASTYALSERLAPYTTGKRRFCNLDVVEEAQR